MRIRNTLVILVASALLPACAANLRQQAATLRAAYVQAAGPSVPEFRNTRGLYSWRPLGDQELLVYTQPRVAYLLDIGFCPDLTAAAAISISSHLGWVTSGLDSVRFTTARYPCRIQQIRPVDLAKFAALRAAASNP